MVVLEKIFAKVQIKTIWSTMLRLYEFTKGYFPSVNYTKMIHTPKNPVIQKKIKMKTEQGTSVG